MSQEEASAYVAEQLAKIISNVSRQTLRAIKFGQMPETQRINPFTGQPIPPDARVRVHQKLSDAGLLDDPAFCEDLTEVINNCASSPVWQMLAWNDGAWVTEDGRCIQIHLDDGSACHGYMHEIVGNYTSKPVWTEIE